MFILHVLKFILKRTVYQPIGRIYITHLFKSVSMFLNSTTGWCCLLVLLPSKTSSIYYKSWYKQIVTCWTLL